MSVTVRFAPSPTGKLHVGNVRAALFNYLFARSQGGRFLLRIDDTDTERSTQEYIDGIITDLAWLGLKYDDTFKQSDRIARYDEAVKFLKEKELLYPCFETPEELDRKRKIQRAQGKPPVYDRAALALSNVRRAEFIAEGRKPHWRFKLSGGKVEWTDSIRGPCGVDTTSISDPILVREDGSYLYTLPSVVDDIEAGVTHILRGEDHVTNSGAQIEIFEALSGGVPTFAHTSLLVDAKGEGFSKRLGSLSIQALREEGIEPLAIVSLLAKLGTSDPVEPRFDLNTLVSEFDMSKLGRAPARFDPEELLSLNAKIITDLPYEDAREHLEMLGVAGGEDFWTAVRPNLKRLSEAAEWWKIVEGPVSPVINDVAYIEKAAELLPEGPFDTGTWEKWTAAVKEATGAKGKALYLPLRLALTGQAQGPEMHQLLCLIGPDRTKARLRGEQA